MKSYLFSVILVLLLAAASSGWVALDPTTQAQAFILVTSTQDSGPGTLRQALQQAQPGTTIRFSTDVFPQQSPAAIEVLSGLPDLERGSVTIDASDAGVVLDGRRLTRNTETPGLGISSNKNVVKGLQILNFPASGIGMADGAQNNTIGGVEPGQGNVISGNWDGINIVGADTAFNQVLGNYIGTDSSGTAANGNLYAGIWIGEGAHDNIIGGEILRGGNVISANNAGITLQDTSNNVISGNLIGTDSSGAKALGNLGDGINFNQSARGNIIGGSSLEKRNVISANGISGINLAGPALVADNQVTGNYIGVDVSGMNKMGNSQGGIIISGGARSNKIGPGNLISGNWDGINIIGDGTTQNRVFGNYIGTDASGTRSLGNQVDGVWMGEGAHENVIGGLLGADGNLISGNGSNGIILQNAYSNRITGNIVGMDASGGLALGNNGTGIGINQQSRENIIGGLNDGEGNLVSANGGLGFHLNGSGVSANIILGNTVGLNAGDEEGFGNETGMLITGGANRNQIGPGNTIASNRSAGVIVSGAGSVNNTIIGNSIYANRGPAIANQAGGNLELPAPVIEQVGTRRVSGRSGPEEVIAICSDDAEECRVLEGTTVCDADGFFLYTLPAGSFRHSYITAFARDTAGNTSRLSSPLANPGYGATRELPGIVAPVQVSAEPAVVGTNLGLALFSAVFFGFVSTAFNDILKNNRREIVAFFQKFIPASLQKMTSRKMAGGPAPGQRPILLLLSWAVLILVNAIVESFLDADVGLLDPGRVTVVLTLLASGLVIGGLEWLSDHFAHRKLRRASVSRVEVHWAGLFFALGSVLFSRLMHFTPGYLLGMLGAVYLLPEITGTEASGKRAGIVLFSVFMGGLVFWLASAVLPASLAWLEPVFLTIFLIGLQGVLFELLPLGFLDGSDLWRWRKGLWSVLFAVVLFSFYHFVLNPGASDVQALQQNGVQALLVIMAVYGLATLGLWVGFGRSKNRASA